MVWRWSFWGLPVSTSAAAPRSYLQQADAPVIVIDEVVGQLITLAACPVNGYAVGLGVVLFRLFDICQTVSHRPDQRSPEGGLGIVLDDVVAGMLCRAGPFILIKWISPVSANEFTGEIICTGNEIISGRVADVNARYAAARLHEAGLTVQSLTFLGDHAPLFQETLARGLARSRFIIITGGLGPTEDDITAEAAASVLQLPLHQDEYLLQRLRECFKHRGLTWEDRFARLALVPQGACILDPQATACGFYLKHQDTWLYFLPGVPREMQLLFDNYVLPPLLQVAAGGKAVCQRTLRFFGLHETELENLFHRVCRLHEGLSVGYYPNFPENHLTLTVRGPSSQAVEATLDQVTGDLLAQAGDACLGAVEKPWRKASASCCGPGS